MVEKSLTYLYHIRTLQLLHCDTNKQFYTTENKNLARLRTKEDYRKCTHNQNRSYDCTYDMVYTLAYVYYLNYSSVSKHVLKMILSLNKWNVIFFQDYFNKYF